MQRKNSRGFSVEEMCNILRQHLLTVTQGTDCLPAAQAICRDPEGICFARLLKVLDQVQIPPSRFFAEVLQLWEDPAGQRVVCVKFCKKIPGLRCLSAFLSLSPN